MKRYLAMALCAMMLCCMCGSALAAELDLSTIRENQTLYTIDVNVEDDAAFIESTLSAEARAFKHKYESSKRYSGTMFDILVVDYLQSDAYPVMRLWVTYCADDAYLNISSATFVIGDKKYTFSGIADKDWYMHDEDGYLERVLIKFGLDNIDFLVALEELFSDTDDILEAASSAKGKLILHGREDVEVDLGEGFFLDFLIMKLGMVNINGLDFLGSAIASTMKVSNAD